MRKRRDFLSTSHDHMTYDELHSSSRSLPLCCVTLASFRFSIVFLLFFVPWGQGTLRGGYCYNHALSDPFRFLYGHLRPFRLQPTLRPLRPIQLSCCIQLVPLMHKPWGFRNEGLLSVPQIKHMTYATMLLSYCSYCLLHTSFCIRLISVFSINTYYVLLYL
jgi:hypothetical protein